MTDFLIAGMQRCTLADYPGEVACTLFTQGCNWRCSYCHNGSLIGRVCPSPIATDEVFSFLRSRRGRVNAVVITGGEPTQQPGLAGFCAALKQQGLKVKLDTNGTNPAAISHLLAEGLVDYVAMDVKQPREQYAKAAGCYVNVEALDESIALLRRQRHEVDYEFRTTIIPVQHTTEAVGEIARWVAGAKVLYLQPFQPKYAQATYLRNTAGPTEPFMRECQAYALPHLPTFLR